MLTIEQAVEQLRTETGHPDIAINRNHQQVSPRDLAKVSAAILALDTGSVPTMKYCRTKGERPSFGWWDTHLDFATGHDHDPGFEVSFRVGASVVVAMIGHYSTGSCPAGPCGEKTGIQFYRRPARWPVTEGLRSQFRGYGCEEWQYPQWSETDASRMLAWLKENHPERAATIEQYEAIVAKQVANFEARAMLPNFDITRHEDGFEITERNGFKTKTVVTGYSEDGEWAYLDCEDHEKYGRGAGAKDPQRERPFQRVPARELHPLQ